MYVAYIIAYISRMYIAHSPFAMPLDWPAMAVKHALMSSNRMINSFCGLFAFYCYYTIRCTAPPTPPPVPLSLVLSSSYFSIFLCPLLLLPLAHSLSLSLCAAPPETLWDMLIIFYFAACGLKSRKELQGRLVDVAVLDVSYSSWAFRCRLSNRKSINMALMVAIRLLNAHWSQLQQHVDNTKADEARTFHANLALALSLSSCSLQPPLSLLQHFRLQRALPNDLGY